MQRSRFCFNPTTFTRQTKQVFRYTRMCPSLFFCLLIVNRQVVSVDDVVQSVLDIHEQKVVTRVCAYRVTLEGDQFAVQKRCERPFSTYASRTGSYLQSAQRSYRRRRWVFSLSTSQTKQLEGCVPRTLSFTLWRVVVGFHDNAYRSGFDLRCFIVRIRFCVTVLAALVAVRELRACGSQRKSSRVGDSSGRRVSLL